MLNEVCVRLIIEMFQHWTKIGVVSDLPLGLAVLQIPFGRNDFNDLGLIVTRVSMIFSR